MSSELVYTSAQRGLKPGSAGFCTVAADGGMSRPVMAKIELLSGYEFCYNLSDPNADRNPVNFAHTRIAFGSESQALSVFSRVAFCGADYSGRANKIAHHFLLSADDRLPAGPARMMAEMARRDIFHVKWTGPPGALPAVSLATALAAMEGGGGPAQAWARFGDPGWAGVLARAFCRSKKVPAYVIYQPGVDVLRLFEESLRLLPEQMRWEVCFATYYTSSPPDCHYHWRGIAVGSSAVKEMRRFPGATVIDLTKELPPIAEVDEDEFVAAAREGTIVPSLVRAAHRPVEAPAPQSQAPASPIASPIRFADDEEEDVIEVPQAAQPAPARPPLRRTAPRAGLPPSHFVSVERTPPRMKKLVTALSVAACLLFLSNVVTLWLLLQRPGEEDNPGGQNTAVTNAQGTTTPAAAATNASGTTTPAAAATSASGTTTPAAAVTNASGTTTPVAAVTTAQGATTPPAGADNKPPPPPIEKTKFELSRARGPDRLFKQGDRVVYLERPWENGEISVTAQVPKVAGDSKDKWRLVDPPAQLKNKGVSNSDPKDGSFIIDCPNASGLGAQELVKATLFRVGDKLALRCEAVEAAWKEPKYRAMVESLVISVYPDERDEAVHFALRLEKKLSAVSVKLGWDGTNAPAQRKDWEGEVRYPWPESLTLEPGTMRPVQSRDIKVGNYGSQVTIRPEDGKVAVAIVSWALYGKLREWDGKKGTLLRKTQSRDTQNTELAQLRKKNADERENKNKALGEEIKGVEERIKGDAEKSKRDEEIAKLKQEFNINFGKWEKTCKEAEGTIQRSIAAEDKNILRIQAEIEEIRLEIQAAFEKLKTEQRPTVYDAWGLPVAEIVFYPVLPP